MAKASLVLGICGLTFISCIAGLVLGTISRNRPGVKHKIALAGIILNSAALAATILFFVLIIIL